MELLNITIRKFLDPIAYLISLYKLYPLLKYSEIIDVLDATKTYYGRGCYERISMTQKDKEIIRLSKLVLQKKPKIILEIGTKKGGTLFLWSRLMRADLIISIDLYRGPYGGGYSPKKKKFYKAFMANRNGKMVLIQGDSHDKKIINKINKILSGRKIDFLFIDGDHSYNGVESDYYNYQPFVSTGGLIAFHDIVENPSQPTIEVPRFWKKIRNNFEYEEIIEEKDKQSMGIGVIQK